MNIPSKSLNYLLFGNSFQQQDDAFSHNIFLIFLIIPRPSWMYELHYGEGGIR